MHDTAYEIGGKFLKLYGRSGQRILDLGSYNVNGTLKDFQPRDSFYVGADLASGPGVDVVVPSASPLPFRPESFDVILSTSAFEHDPAFWETFLELARVLKTGGVLYLNVPSNGWYHRYPLDCWRLYPDAGKALEVFARRKGYVISLVESFIADRKMDRWNDFVAVFVKSSAAKCSSVDFLSDMVSCTNIWRMGETQPQNMRTSTEDMVIIERLQSPSPGDDGGYGSDIGAAINDLDQLAGRALSLQRRLRNQVLRGTSWLKSERLHYVRLFSAQEQVPETSQKTRIKFVHGSLVISALDNDPRLTIKIPSPHACWLIAKIEIVLEAEAVVQVFTKTVAEPSYHSRHAISRDCPPGNSIWTLILARDEPIEAVRVDPMDRPGTAVITLLELHAPVASIENDQ